MTHAIRPVDFDDLKTMTYEVTDRVARITNIKELNTLDHTTIINVEARNNTFS